MYKNDMPEANCTPNCTHQVTDWQSPAGRAATSWFAVAAVLLCGTAVAMNLGKVAVAMSQLRREFGLSLVEASYLSSMINTLAVTCGLIIGLLAGRTGTLRMCVGGMLVSVLGTAGALAASGTTLLLVSRFLEGAGLVCVAVSGPSLLTAATTTYDRRIVLSMWSAYVPAGVGLAMLISPLTMEHGGWHTLWLITAVLLAGALLAILLNRSQYRSHPAPNAAASRPDGAGSMLTSAAPWMLALAMGTWSLQHFALIIWLPTFLAEQRSLEPGLIAVLCCVMVLANVPGNLLGGLLLHRGHGRGTLIASTSAFALLAGAGVYHDVLGDTQRYALCVALSFAGGVIPAAVFSSSAVLARTPAQIATLQGLFMQCSNLGSFMGPPVIAWLVAGSGHWQAGYAATGSAAVVGVALGLMLHKTGH